MYSQLFGVIPSLHNIAQELVDDIVSYLEVQDQHAVLLTSQDLHDITARRMYRHVEVGYPQSKIFCRTVAESQKKYGRHTVSLRYNASCFVDPRCSYILLYHALPHLPRISQLTLHIRPQISPYLIVLVQRRHIVYPGDWEDTEETNEILQNCDTQSMVENGFYNLKTLRTLTLHGDTKLLSLMDTSALTTVRITAPMDVNDTSLFISLFVTTGGTNERVTELALSLHHVLGSRIGSMIFCIGNAFPKLQRLYLRSCSMNALDASQALTLSPPIMTSIQEFHMNDWSIVEPMFFLPKSDALSLQECHILKAAEEHRDLHTLRFGVIAWKRTISSIEWKSEESSPTDPVEAQRAMCADDPLAPDYPLFWDIDYDTPPELSAIDTDILSSSTESDDGSD